MYHKKHDIAVKGNTDYYYQDWNVKAAGYNKISSKMTPDAWDKKVKKSF